MSGHFKVKNFEQFQHYKDRSPPWIKLYNELLDDYDFSRLPDASKAHLLAIWLLASRYGNKIPHDPEWIARRINATTKVDLGILERTGFIIVDQPCSETLASCAELAMPERERETEKRERRDREEKTDSWSVAGATRPTVDQKFDQFWSWYPKRDGSNPRSPARKLFLQLIRSGVDPDDIIAGARRCADRDRDKIGTPYIPQTMRWLRDRRWEDYSLDLEPAETVPQPPAPNLPSDEELRRQYARLPNGRSETEGDGIRPEGRGVLREDTERIESENEFPHH